VKWFDNLRGDFLGGVTTSVIALPLAIAFGVAAFAPLGPEYVAQGALAGLYASIIAGAFASIFGGTPSQISGPTAPMSVIVTSVIVSLMKDPELANLGVTQVEIILLLVSVTIVLGGLFQILLGVVGGGRLIKYIPYPVVAGFMNGIAVIIFLSQVRPFFGVSKSAPLASIVTGQADFGTASIVVGVVTILAMLVSERLIRAIPAALIGLVAGIATYFVIGSVADPDLIRLQDNPLIIGPIPSGLPTPKQAFAFVRLISVIPMEKLAVLAVPGVTLGILAAIDTLLTSVVSDMVTKTKHNSNKELVGQGIGNLTSAMFGGLPAAGSTIVTMVNVNAGGRTPLSGVFKGLAVLAVILFLGPLVQWIPMAVLAGILMVTATKMVDYESINLFKKKSAFENLLIVLAVMIITVSVDIITAVGIGLVIASFLFVKDQIGKTIVRRKYHGDVVHSKKVRDREAMQILEEQGHRITVYELSGSLFFGTCDKLLSEIEHDLDGLCIILDLKRVNTIDLTGAQLIRQMVDRVQEKGNYLLLSYLDVPGDPDKERLRRFMEDIGVIKVVGTEHIFPDTDHALEWAEDTLIELERAEARKHREALVLRSLMVFQDLSEDQLKVVQKYLQPKSFRKGDIIFEEGEPGDGIYFILGGYVSVLAGLTGDGRARRLATFAEGVFFGDMAILEDQPRSATVRAETDTEVLFMPKEEFWRLTDSEPAIASRMLLGIAREVSYRLRVTTAEVRALAE
jgi:SulP family sulfate permease